MTNVELSYKQIIVIEAAVYRFKKENYLDMSDELRNDCSELIELFGKLERTQ